jgi:hypothetical protein
LGKIDSFKLEGLDLFFNSNDHLPQHFHARKSGAWEIRVYFLLCSKEKGLIFDIKYPLNAQITSKDKSRILKLVLENRSKLLKEWERKVCLKEDL